MADPKVSRPRLVPATMEHLREAAALMRDAHAVVAYPTETCYGLAVDALDAAALEQLQRVKGRAEGQPISVLVADLEMLGRVVARMSPLARTLMERYWPGALTLILPAREGLPGALLNPRGGIALRVSADPIAQQLVSAVGGPISATSANRSGCAEARVAQDALGLAGVSLIVDGGRRDQPPSTLIDMTDHPVILRRGALDVDLG